MPQSATQDTDATLIGNAHIPIAEINPYMPTTAKAFTGPPTLGPILETGQRRALLGWTHKKDTPEGLLTGRLWCWVGEGKGNFQVSYSSRRWGCWCSPETYLTRPVVLTV
jgi:hypothetical protein